MKYLQKELTSGEYLYDSQPTDVIYQLQNSSNTGQNQPTSVNLNEVAYYAFIGMKPQQIAHLVGVGRSTIWDNSVIRKAFEEGQANHQLMLRSELMKKAKNNPMAADILLTRTAGKADDDAQNGMAPENRQTKDVEIKLVVEERSNDPRIKEIENTLDAILREQPL